VREAFVGELIPDVGEEVSAVGFSVEKFLVLFGREGEVAVDFAAVEAKVKQSAWRDVGRGGQKL
jgi:hypothetical protein